MQIENHIVSLPIIKASQKRVFKEIFYSEYLYSDKTIFLEGYPLIIFPRDFLHICYESAKGGQYKQQFSKKRARKILLIREICEGNLPYKTIYQKDRENKSICILLEYAEFSIFLLPQKSSKGIFLRLLTIISYGKKVESVIEKQKRAGVLVDNVKEAVRLRGSTASQKPTDR